MSHPFQEGPAGPRPVIALRVFRQEQGQSHFVRLLSSHYGGCFTHYVKERSQYCDPQACRWGCPKAPQVWKGYAAADVYDDNAKLWMPVCFELTEALELDFRGRWRRGQVWRVTRPVKKKKKQEARFAVFVEQHPECSLPQEFDFIPCLLNTFHIFAIDLAFKNPLPPRVLVEATAGPVPGQAAKVNEQASREAFAEFGRRAQLLANIGRMPDQTAKNGPQRPSDGRQG